MGNSLSHLDDLLVQAMRVFKALERPKETLKCPLEERDLDTNEGTLLLK